MLENILFINNNKLNKSDFLINSITNYNIINLTNEELYNLDFNKLILYNLKSIFIDNIDINLINYINKIKVKNKNIHIFIFSNDIITIDKSYVELLDIKGTCSFIINDNIFALTKEKSIIQLSYSEFEFFVKENIEDEYFSTQIIDSKIIDNIYINKFKNLLDLNFNSFNKVNDIIFGAIALRTDFGFITTTRGKKDLLNIASIYNVNFNDKIILSDKKGSLNVPLLFKIFNDNKNVQYIIHSHNLNNNYESFKYHMPGTINDSNRTINKSFNIDFHGSFDLYDFENKLILK